MTALDPVLKNVLHLDSDDPGAFAIAIFKRAHGILGKLQNRAVHRAGLSVIVIPDSDPHKAGQQHARIDLRIGDGDSWQEIAAKFATFVMRGAKAQALLVDEARLMLMGQPEGPRAKALDGGDDFHVDETQLVPDTAFQILSHGGSRGLLGFDEATAAAVLAIGVPLLCALIPVLLPMLIQLGTQAFQVITGAAGSSKEPPPCPQGLTRDPATGDCVANPIDALADKVGLGTPDHDDTFKVIIILGVLVGGVIYLRRHGKLGG